MDSGRRKKQDLRVLQVDQFIQSGRLESWNKFSELAPLRGFSGLAGLGESDGCFVHPRPAMPVGDGREAGFWSPR
jgi:hypothetical protein